MNTKYTVNSPITCEQFIDVLQRSTLGQRRPTDDYECMKGMLGNSNLVVCAWNADLLIGIARSVTDYHYSCYLSDLAVDTDYQKQGIGTELQRITQGRLGPRCTIVLLAAPAAAGYYPRLGYEKHDHCWIMSRHKTIASQREPNRVP